VFAVSSVSRSFRKVRSVRPPTQSSSRRRAGRLAHTMHELSLQYLFSNSRGSGVGAEVTGLINLHARYLHLLGASWERQLAFGARLPSQQAAPPRTTCTWAHRC